MSAVASKFIETIEGVAPPLYREPGRMIGTVAEVSVNVVPGLLTSVKTRLYDAEKFFTPSLRTLMLKSWIVFDQTTLVWPTAGSGISMMLGTDAA